MTSLWRVRWAIPTALLFIILPVSVVLALLTGVLWMAALPALATVLLAVAVVLLYRQLQQNAAQSQALLRLSHDLAGRLEVGELFDNIVQAILRLVPLTDKCVIHLLDEERQKLYPRYSSQPAWQHSLGMPLGKGIAGQALQELRTIVIPDVRREAGFLPLQSSADLRALMVAPLHVQGRLMGTISLNSATPDAFSSKDEVLVTTLAAQASAALRQAQLREDAQREAHYIAAIMNSLDDGLVVLDAERRILRHNPSLAHILGPDMPTLVGRSLDEIAAGPALRRLAAIVGPVGQDPRRAMSRQVEIREPIHAVLQVSISPIATAGGEWEQIVVIHDQTDELDLIRAETDVLAGAAAEMVPALSELRGLATLLQTDTSVAAQTGDDFASRCLAHIQAESARLMRLAADLADLDGLQAGTLHLSRRTTPLSEVTADLRTELETLADSRQVAVHFDGPADLSLAVDPERFFRAMANLLEDAVRRAEPGGEVTCALEVADEELSAVIRDDGQNIDPMVRERAFRRHYRYGERPTGGALPGVDLGVPLAAQFVPGQTGLGLYVSRRLIEAHGGHLWIPEDDEAGNEIHFIVPLATGH